MSSYRRAKALAGRLIRRVSGNNQRLMGGLTLISYGIEMWLSGKGVPRFSKQAISRPGSGSGPLQIGVNIIGYATGEFGLAAAARGTIRAVETVGLPHVVNNVMSPNDASMDDSIKNFASDNPYSVNLVHMNPLEAELLRAGIGNDFFKNRYNIGYWYWELSEIPDDWLRCFVGYDEIWVGSDFCLSAVSKDSPIPVAKVPPCVQLDMAGVDTRRSRFGLRDDQYVFLFTFDYRSYPQRKNPVALVDAFKLAFSDRKDVVLILKCVSSPNFEKERRALDEAVSQANIRIVDEQLRKQDLYSLTASCDCYVSLHRSEGFGLPIAEAMYLGKPVIATGYSGNMDFMTPNNSFAVKFRLIEVGLNEYTGVRKGVAWAEADVEHAAELMRFVYENREIAANVGKRASEDIKARYSPLAVGHEIRARLSRALSTRGEAASCD